MDLSEEGDFLHAIDRYTEAITLNKNNHILFSNRSAAYARVGKFSEALGDAKRCHELKPDWPKVHMYIATCHQPPSPHHFPHKCVPVVIFQYWYLLNMDRVFS